MENTQNIDMSLFEHRFWLQIMGDHARFIFTSLAPTEEEHIQKAHEFICVYDQLLDQSRKPLSSSELSELNRMAYEVTYRFREFKLKLLSLHLTADIKFHLSPTLINDMVNELDEYILIINSLASGKTPVFHPLHYHILWLTDAIGHAGSITATFDLVEKDMMDTSARFELQFSDLYLKSVMLNGYLRTQLPTYPALERFHEQVVSAIVAFIEFLEKIQDLRMDARVLGTLQPLMADHMSREECYYLVKLSQAASNVRKPDCDPTRRRIES